MTRTFMRAKIHRATVTGAELHYMGSITIDAALLAAVDVLPYEKVHVLNLDNGARVETYVIAGRARSGQIQINGAAARHFARHDRVIIIAYVDAAEEEIPRLRPKVAFVDGKNRLLRVRTDRIRSTAQTAGRARKRT